MKLFKVVKTHKTKEGKEFKKMHFYLDFGNGVRTEILPNDFKQNNGYFNNRSSDLLNVFAEYLKEE